MWVILTLVSIFVLQISTVTCDGDVLLMVVGGFTNDFSVQTHGYALSANSIEWAFQGSDMSFGMLNPGVTSDDSNMWLVGGKSSTDGEPGQRALHYIIDYDSWYELPRLRIDREYGPATFKFGNTIYAAGGNQGQLEMESLFLQNTEDGWEIENVTLPYDVWATDAVVVMDTVFIIGGVTSTPELGFSDKVISWKEGWNEWKHVGNMPGPEEVHGVTADGKDTIFVISGLGKFHEYTISSNSWSILADMPNSLSNIGCSFNDGTIVVTGGMDPSGKLSDIIYIYDVTEHMWYASWETQLKAPLRSHGVSLMIPGLLPTTTTQLPQTTTQVPAEPDDVMITVGGWTGQHVNQDTEIYNISVTDIEWSHSGAKMPVEMKQLSVVHSQSELLAVSQEIALRYDIDQDTWHLLPNLTVSRSHAPMLFVLSGSDKLYAAGGKTKDTTVESISLDNPDKGWNVETVKLPCDFANTHAVVIGKTAYIAGGNSDICGKQNLLYSWEEGWTEWKELNSMYIPRFDHCLVTDGYDKIYAIGGFSEATGTFINIVEEYSKSTGRWSIKQDVPGELCCTACIYHDYKVIVSGGMYQGNKISPDVHIYDLVNDKWSTSNSKLSTQLSGHGAVHAQKVIE